MPKRLSKFKKWILFDYALLSLFVSGVYIAFNHEFFKVNWKRYYNNITYEEKVDKILKHGVFWIPGNLHSLTAPLLIALLLGGALLSLIIFALVWKNYLVRTWLPLFSFMGFILPLLIRYDENILKLLVIGYFLVILSSSFLVAALRQW